MQISGLIMSGTSLLFLGTIGAALIIAVIRYLIDLGEEKATYCAPVAALLLSSILPLLLVPVKFCCVTFAYFLFVYPAIEATENNIAHVVKKTENFSVSSLIFPEPSSMKEGKTGGSDRHFAEQREAVKLAAPCHCLKFRDGVLPSRGAALEAVGRVIADRGEKGDNTPPDCFREAPAVADLILEPVDFVRTGGVFSGFPEEGHEVGSEAVALAFPCVNGNGGANENNSGKTVCKSVFVSGIENVKQKENEHGNSSLLAGCFNGCYRRHSARSVSIFRNIHRCGFFRKNI